MKKFVSMLKATMSGDMNIFAYRVNKDSVNKKSKNNGLVMPLFLGLCVMFAMFTYAKLIGEPLKEAGYTYVMLTIFIIISVIVTFIEGAYKSQGILFDAKDNDLLFSLPIKKSSILLSRMIKLISIQYIYNLLFTIPILIEYVILENPGFNFYIISIIMFILVPLIPTILGCIIGYLIKAFSNIFGKSKKFLQIAFTTAFTVGIFIFSFNMQNVLGSLAANATNINELLTNIYYPVGLYVELIQQFDIFKLLILLAISIIPTILFVYIFSIKYFKIISKSSESVSKGNYKFEGKKIKSSSKLKALTIKELRKYFSSTIYVFNTAFGVILMLIITIAMSVNITGVAEMVAQGEAIDISMIINILPKIFLALIVFTASMSTITSSSISLEGKSFEITKSLPVSTKKIFSAKVLASNIILIPLMLLSAIIFIVKFNVNIFDSSLIILLTFLMPTFIAMLGLIINLKYPMLNAKSDTMVVKQSTSTMVAVLMGMVIAIVSIALCAILSGIIGIENSILLGIGLVIIAILVCYQVLNTYGIKKFRELNS